MSSLPGVLSQPLLLLLPASERGAALTPEQVWRQLLLWWVLMPLFAVAALQPSARVPQSSGELPVPRLRLHLQGSCSTLCRLLALRLCV